MARENNRRGIRRGKGRAKVEIDVKYMTIEAMEEGNLGVYEVHVNRYISDGRITLCKFILTNRSPIGGMKGKALSQLRSVYKTVEGVEKDINIYLKTAHKSFKGKKKGVTAAGLICLKKHHFNDMYVWKSRRISQAYDLVSCYGLRLMVCSTET